MTSSGGKIDNLEKVIIKLSEDFKSLEDKQITVLQRHIEVSAATTIAAFKKELGEIHEALILISNAIKACDCNKKVIKVFEDKLGKIPEGVLISPKPAASLPAPTGMARDDKSPTGLKPATISTFVYTPRPL